MKKIFILFLSVIFIPLLGLGQNGLTFGSYSGELSNIDLETATQTFIATTETHINASDFGPGNVLYGINSNTSAFFEIDTITGATTSISTISLANRVWSGLAFDPEYGVMYGMSVVVTGTPNSSLYGIDLEDGSITLVGSQSTAPEVACIAMDNDGNLYGMDISTEDASIYLIDRLDGSVTLVGETGLSGSGLGHGMDFCVETETMYLTTQNAALENTLRIVDLDDGSTTEVGELLDETGAIVIPTPLTAEFSADETTVCGGKIIHFTDESYGALEWQWTFEGGSPSTSTIKNPTIFYNNIGTFDVTLTIWSGANSDIIIKEDYITVVDTPEEPNEPTGDDTGWPGSTAEFTVEEVEYATTYVWSLTPEEAGTITGDGLVGTVIWATDFIGDAEVAVSAENDCGTSPISDPHFVMVDFVGIDNNQSTFVKVYPNPVNNILNINFKNIKSKEVAIELFSAQGVSVLNREVSNSGNEAHAELDISNLANGVYYLVIKSNDSIIRTEKILKF